MVDDSSELVGWHFAKNDLYGLIVEPGQRREGLLLWSYFQFELDSGAEVNRHIADLHEVIVLVVR